MMNPLCQLTILLVSYCSLRRALVEDFLPLEARFWERKSCLWTDTSSLDSWQDGSMGFEFWQWIPTVPFFLLLIWYAKETRIRVPQ